MDELTGQLTVENVTLSNEGEYTCHAYNTHGILVTSMDVEVMIRPSIISSKNDVVVETSQRAILPCRAIGKPKVKIR